MHSLVVLLALLAPALAAENRQYEDRFGHVFLIYASGRTAAEILAALQCVDLATIFPEIRARKFLAAVRPAVYVKGGDYTPGTLDQEERAILTEIGSAIRLIPFEIGYSTSGLIEQICTSRSGQTQ